MHNRLNEDSELMIDAVRGIAALLVMMTHTFDLSVADVFGWEMRDSPEGWRMARATFGHGGYWVWCFFMISGLCIQQSISRGVREHTFTWPKYVLARITRIYPLFLSGLALAVITWLLHEDFGGHPDDTPWRQFGASLASLHIFTTAFPGYETSWSLSCEMIYYMLWPAALLLLRRHAISAAYASLVGSLFVCAGILVVWKVFHKLETSAAVDGMFTLFVLYPVWLCGAWLAGHWRDATARISRRLWIASIALCLSSEALLAVLKYMQYPGWAIHLASWSSIPGLMIFLAGAHHAHISKRAWARPVCRWLGQFSFPCYILHMQMLLILDHYLRPVLPFWIEHNPVFHFIALLVPVLGSLAILGPRLERWVMAWRSRLLGGATRVPAAVTA